MKDRETVAAGDEPACARDERGAAMMEYGIVVTGIAVVVAVAANTFGLQLGALYTSFLAVIP